jgi:hypothetical protein
MKITVDGKDYDNICDIGIYGPYDDCYFKIECDFNGTFLARTIDCGEWYTIYAGEDFEEAYGAIKNIQDHLIS